MAFRTTDMSDLADELLGVPATRRGSLQQRPMPGPAPGVEPRPGPIAFTILGAPVSHKNGYHVVTLGRGSEKERTAIVKSKEALAYERDALRQIPPAARLRLEGPVAIAVRLFYETERPDMDESLILDVLQDRWDRAHGPHAGEKKRNLVQAGVYRNDRQIVEKHVTKAVDARNPRAEITVQALSAKQQPLL
jgi:Holliday junction resolvase RusA-like endonuclease